VAEELVEDSDMKLNKKEAENLDKLIKYGKKRAIANLGKHGKRNANGQFKKKVE
jgi:hypothetical protein